MVFHAFAQPLLQFQYHYSNERVAFSAFQVLCPILIELIFHLFREKGSLIDDISRMSASQQKLLWMDLNKKKLSILVGELAKSVPPNNLLQADIDQLINEAKRNGRKKKG